MSNTYQDLNLTNYPDSIDKQMVFVDIDATLVDLINLYYSYINSKNFTAANQLLNDNPKLQQCIVNALTMNKISHQIIALQRQYLSDFQKYIEDAITYQGVWLPTVEYNKFEVVKYGEMYYIAIHINIPIGTLPTNTQYFVSWSIKGEQGESGLGMSPRGIWNTATQYYKYDVVSYDNYLWYAIKDNIASMPNTSSNDWQVAIKIMLYGSETETTSTMVQADGKIVVNVKNQFSTIDF